MMPAPQFHDYIKRGWVVFDCDSRMSEWIAKARTVAEAAVSDPEFAHWLDCDGTWFVGVDVLDNDPKGRVDGVALEGVAIDFIKRYLGPLPPLHRAQVSVTWPGYPRPRHGESDAAARYRRVRDAAHIDGVLAIGPERRRYVKEPHAFILGLPLSDAAPDAAPLVVWEGSHVIMRSAFASVFEGRDPSEWSDIDVTEAYIAARKKVFDQCHRRELPLRPGQAVLLHRLALHGVAPWAEGATSEDVGRMIAYFRPELTGGVVYWIGDQP